MVVKKVLLIRHGQTDYNLEHRLQGSMPIPLNDCGRKQARALAQYLSGGSIDAIYSSPMLRAKETAEIIGEAIKLDVREDPRLGEIAFGVFEGHTMAEIERLQRDAHRKWTSGYKFYRVPQGESRDDVRQRMRAAWSDIVNCSDAETVAIVGHGSAIMIFLASLFAFLPDAPVKNSSVTAVERYEDSWEMTTFADMPHLPEKAVSSLKNDPFSSTIAPSF